MQSVCDNSIPVVFKNLEKKHKYTYANIYFGAFLREQVMAKSIGERLWCVFARSAMLRDATYLLLLTLTHVDKKTDW